MTVPGALDLGSTFGGTPALAWDTTLSRHLLHRWAVSEVLLTDAVPTAPDRYDVAVQWPRGHRHYRPDAAGRPDPLLVVETIRQAGVYLGHAFYGVPMDRLFALQRMTFSLDPALEPRPTPARPTSSPRSASTACGGAVRICWGTRCRPRSRTRDGSSPPDWASRAW